VPLFLVKQICLPSFHFFFPSFTILWQPMEPRAYTAIFFPLGRANQAWFFLLHISSGVDVARRKPLALGGSPTFFFPPLSKAPRLDFDITPLPLLPFHPRKLKRPFPPLPWDPLFSPPLVNKFFPSPHTWIAIMICLPPFPLPLSFPSFFDCNLFPSAERRRRSPWRMIARSAPSPFLCRRLPFPISPLPLFFSDPPFNRRHDHQGLSSLAGTGSRGALFLSLFFKPSSRGKEESFCPKIFQTTPSFSPFFPFLFPSLFQKRITLRGALS